MSDTAPLSYATHRKLVPLYHFVLVPGAMVNVLLSFWQLGSSLYAGTFTFQIAWNTVLAILLAIAVMYIRMFPLGVQDRLIRLEQRMRLAELLPPELQSAIPHLTTEQLIALRFASDEEVPELVHACRKESGVSSEDLKKRIKTWVSDPVRI